MVADGITYSPRRPIIRVCIIHIWNRIQIKGAMAREEILTMLLRQTSDPILNVEGFMFAGLDGERGGRPLDGGRGGRGRLDVKGIAINFLHSDEREKKHEPA
jgi:hypothetical protein